MKLAFDLKFEDLYTREGLIKLDSAFVEELAKANADVHNRFVAARTDKLELPKKDESNLLIDIAPHLEDFTAKLFGITKQAKALAAQHDELANIYTCKRIFVQRQVVKKYKAEEAVSFDGAVLRKKLEKLFGEELSEKTYADNVNAWLENLGENEANIDLAAQYAAWALYAEDGIKFHKKGVLFKIPRNSISKI